MRNVKEPYNQLSKFISEVSYHMGDARIDWILRDIEDACDSVVNDMEKVEIDPDNPEHVADQYNWIVSDFCEHMKSIVEEIRGHSEAMDSLYEVVETYSNKIG